MSYSYSSKLAKGPEPGSRGFTLPRSDAGLRAPTAAAPSTVASRLDAKAQHLRAAQEWIDRNESTEMGRLKLASFIGVPPSQLPRPLPPLAPGGLPTAVPVPLFAGNLATPEKATRAVEAQDLRQEATARLRQAVQARDAPVLAAAISQAEGLGLTAEAEVGRGWLSKLRGLSAEQRRRLAAVATPGPQPQPQLAPVLAVRSASNCTRLNNENRHCIELT